MDDVKEMHRALLAWYDGEKRDLPWRHTHDPYAIWVSEIMLQQTQVATVIPYYHRWLARFPTVQALAEADDQDVLAQWQGLGYYRRCRLLLEGARFVAEKNGWPQSAEEWRKVPGVGPYTAGAIASIAFNQPTPLVDGNVERVFSRLTACRDSGPQLKKSAWTWAEGVTPHKRPGDWNQALMELGATVCKPGAPLCGACPLIMKCEAHRQGVQNELPIGGKKEQAVELTHLCWVPIHNDRFGIRQITTGEWWAGMWEFPRVTNACPQPHWLQSAEIHEVGVIKHMVTKHKIKLVISLAYLTNQLPELRWLTLSELESVALPAPQRKVLRLALAHIRAEQPLLF